MKRISLLFLLLATGCGSATVTAATPPTCASENPTGTLDTKVLYQTRVDYPAFDTPEKLARESAEAIVVGKVTGWLPGPVVEEGGLPGDRTHYVLLRAQVERRLKGTTDDVVYFPFYQGALGGKGETPFQGVDAFERAVPAGTRVLMFLKTARRTGTDVEDRAGLPPDTHRYSAVPQGIVLHEVGPDGRGRTVGGKTEMSSLTGWNEPCGIDGLIARLEANGFTG